MPAFKRILFVSHGLNDETPALECALKLATEHQATLDALIVCPPFPGNLHAYQASYEASLTDNLNKAILRAKTGLALARKKIDISIEVAPSATPAVRIIQQVLQGKHDLVIKKADQPLHQKGFKAIDMALLRKCPCALLLHRPFQQHSSTHHFAVAIDPKDNSSEATSLSLELLSFASSIKTSYHAKLSILSCWEVAIENYLRDNVWITVPKEEMDKLIQQEKAQQVALLNNFLKTSMIPEDYHVHHLKGSPETQIPLFVTKHNIDLLVMGTVARTGISGFMIGNTAENILQSIDCALLALKPQGFVSPVKAF